MKTGLLPYYLDIETVKSKQQILKIQNQIEKLNNSIEKLNSTIKDINPILFEFSIVEKKKKWYKFW